MCLAKADLSLLQVLLLLKVPVIEVVNFLAFFSSFPQESQALDISLQHHFPIPFHSLARSSSYSWSGLPSVAQNQGRLNILLDSE
jgi:hypothetical protein